MRSAARRSRRSWSWAAVSLAAVLVAGCGGGEHGAPPVQGARVAVVVLENHGPDEVLGDGWLGRQARRGGIAVNAYGEVHPSLGNYLAMLSGSNQGVEDDDVGHEPFSAPTLAGQLTKAGLPWRAYFDAMPSPCFGRRVTHDGVGRYAKRHNPFLFFDDASGDPGACAQHIVPGTQLAADIAARRLGRFTWITPDLCEDMHDCDEEAGQRWMAATLPRLIAALGPHGVLFVTADEGTDGPGGGRIPLVALGAGVRSGARLTTRVDHRHMLATIEDLLGLPRLPTTRGLNTLAGLLRP